jgi:hypothetical protein
MSTLQSRFTTAVRNVALGAIGVGYLPLTGGNLTGNLGIAPTTGGAYLGLTAPTGQYATIGMIRNAGQGAQILGYTSAAPNPLVRWAVYLGDTAAETGGNAGSNFAISRWADGSTNPFIDTPLSISRSTGIVNFARAPTVAGGNMPYLPLTGGTVVGYVTISGNGMTVGGSGIAWAGYSPVHAIGMGWDNANLHGWVDSSYWGAFANQGYVQAVAGNYLPIGGGTITGSLTVNGNTFTRGTTYFSGLGDFYNAYDGRYRYRQWAGSWYDCWDQTNGLRIWGTPSAWIMTCDGGGNVNLTGYLHANGGRVLSQGGQNTSVVCHWPGVIAKGMWVDGSGLWWGGADGAGNPNWGQLLLDSNGYLTQYGSGQCNGNWWTNGQLTCSGDFHAYASGVTHGNMYGYAGCIINGTGVFGGPVFAGGGHFVGGNGDTGVGIYRNSDSSIYQMWPNSYHQLQWGNGSYNMIWIVNGLPLWVQEGSGQHNCWNANGQIGGRNFFQTSDRRNKTDVEPSKYGLREILQMIPVRFMRLPSSDDEPLIPEIGLIAQEIEEIIPEAVLKVEMGDKHYDGPTLTLQFSAITAALINAVKELTARVVELEGAAHV